LHKTFVFIPIAGQDGSFNDVLLTDVPDVTTGLSLLSRFITNIFGIVGQRLKDDCGSW
jgi:hypothetical protein